MGRDLVDVARRSCGQAHCACAGVVDLGSAGLPGAVRRDPAGSAASFAGAVELGRAGGDLERSGRWCLAACDRGGLGSCLVDDQPGGRRQRRSRWISGRAGRPAAWVRARRRKVCKLATHHRLRAMVAEKLQQEQWSPEQIAGWLKATYPNDPEMQVSHETIYRTLFIQSRGALRKELTQHLRTGRVIRRPAGIRLPDGRGGRPGILNISERPAEAVDRAVPGHWEGDLVFGKRMSPVATLVERSTRFVMLVALPGGHKADLVADALAAKITTLPAAADSDVDVGPGPRDGRT